MYLCDVTWLWFINPKKHNNIDVERLCETRLCMCQGLASVDASLLRIFGGVINIGWERFLVRRSWWIGFFYGFPS
jgi:hypothetical protein